MPHFSNYCKHVAFSLLILLAAVMAAATVWEHRCGTAVVAARVYHAAWFGALWAVMTGCGLTWLWHSRPLTRGSWKRHLHLWLLHGALAIILLGAAVTALTAKSGQMHLRLHTPERAYMDDDSPHHALVRLPFCVELTAFEVYCHPGTQTASNYVSHLLVDGRACSVSMNRVQKAGHWRMFQMSFDNDLQGSRLMLRYDPWGEPITYAGYAMLFAALILSLCSPYGALRRTWRKLNRMMALILIGCTMTAAAAREAAPTLPAAKAEVLESAHAEYGGNISTVQITGNTDAPCDGTGMRAERLYHAFDLPAWLYRANLGVALCVFLLSLRRRPASAMLWRGVTAWGVTGFAALTVYIALRMVASGRLPFGNGYETMLSAAWTSLWAGGILALKLRAVPALRCMPFVASGFFLLVATLSPEGAPITPLAPVLDSPLLGLHVSLIMMAYCLLTFTFILAAAAMVRPAEAEMYRLLSYIILYPALALLATGIFTGAVWANQSWGRYWGWDPKEVWALITLIVYALPAHASLWRKHSPRAFHLFMLAAFATVLMTYFGVNYLLGGLHSYAQ